MLSSGFCALIAEDRKDFVAPFQFSAMESAEDGILEMVTWSVFSQLRDQQSLTKELILMRKQRPLLRDSFFLA
jgi:hypothetical protein